MSVSQVMARDEFYQSFPNLALVLLLTKMEAWVRG